MLAVEQSQDRLAATINTTLNYEACVYHHLNYIDNDNLIAAKEAQHPL